MQAQFRIIDGDKLLNLPICLIALEDFVKSQIDSLPCSISWLEIDASSIVEG